MVFGGRVELAIYAFVAQEFRGLISMLREKGLVLVA